MFPFSISSTSDGHLLVGTMISFGLLSVYHEDGTVACGCNSSENVMQKIFVNGEDGKELFAVFALHMTRNGQIIVE